MDPEGNKHESEADTKPSNLLPTNSRLANKETEEKENTDDKKEKIKFDPKDCFYDMTGDKHLVIFNHYEYDPESLSYYRKPPKKRIGTDEDLAALEATFAKLDFKIDIHHDKDRETIWEIFLQLRRRDFSAASCLCIAILTHGSCKDELYAYDEPYNLKDVTKLFENHPTLAGKPKVFFIQACRGGKVDDGNRIAIDGDDKRVIVAPSHADFLIVRSTVEDYMSYRDNRGSWLIQELCKAIQENLQTMDILQIMTLVNQKIALGYATNTPRDSKTHNKRQIPETTFTLTKMLKLSSVPENFSISKDKTSDQSKSQDLKDKMSSQRLCSLN